MSNKQTSIEWLISKLGISELTHKKLFEQAKEMHKQEMQNNIVEATKMITDFEIKIIAQQEATFARSFVRGVEWYIEQLKQRSNNGEAS